MSKKSSPDTLNGKPLRTVNVATLQSAPYNPRVIKDDQFHALCKSIKEFGILQPLILNERTGYIVGGNQRLAAIRHLGIEAVPVVMVDLSLEEEQVANIALNRIGGAFDTELLKPIIAELDKAGLADLTGFDNDELAVLRDHVEPALRIPEPKTVTCPHCGYEWTPDAN